MSVEQETKKRSMQWRHPTLSAPKKAKVVSSAVMATTFWDAKDIAFIDYFQMGHIISGGYCANLSGQLERVIQTKWPGKLTKVVFFREDNALAQKSLVPIAQDQESLEKI